MRTRKLVVGHRCHTERVHSAYCTRAAAASTASTLVAGAAIS